MDVRSLTQTEAVERAALLDVDRYDIEVDITDIPNGREVRCTSAATFTCRRPGASTFVDCAAEVVKATLNGAPLPGADEGRIRLDGLAARNTLVVETVQPNTTDGQGVHKATDPADGEVYLWTSFEPDEARHVWACFDQPDLKAPHGLTVIAPARWRVVSNSPAEKIEPGSDETRTWTFADTPPLSTYNPVVLAGPFHELRRQAAGHDLGILARKSLSAVLERDAEEIFTVTEQGLTFYAEQFAMPFPQEKYDQVFLPEMGGAMENYGCVAWSDSFLRRAAPSHAELQLLAKVLLHEMAHMWFGNIVTMRWWDDLWLNEAFAEFACNWAAERATRYTDAWAHHLVEDKIDAYLADQGPASHAIHQPIHDVAEAASIFDAITYPKGASVLQQLQTYVGEDSFGAGMKEYFRQHSWGNTTLQDLMRALADASGRELDEWRRGWLETAGADRLALDSGDKGFTLVATGPGIEPRPHVLTIGAYRRTPEGLVREQRCMVEVTGERTDLDLPRGADLYLVNDDDLTFATARPDPAGRTALLASAAELPTAISRGVAVATVWDMLITHEATTEEVVHAVAGVLRLEPSDSVVEPYLRLLGEAAEHWSPEALRPTLTAEVAGVCRALSENPARRQVALRGLAGTAREAAELAWVEDQAGDDVDLLWRVQVRRSELGCLEGERVDRLLTVDPDPDAWVRALTVRVAAPTAEAKEEFWQTAAVHRKVPIGAFGAVATAFWRPGQHEVLAPYAARYLELLPRMDEGGMIPAMLFSRRLFPLYAIEEGFLAEAEKAARDVAPVVRRELVERADKVRRMLTARLTSARVP